MAQLFRLLTLLAVSACALGQDPATPGWVGMNEKSDLIINSGPNGSILANGIDVLARLSHLYALIDSLNTTVYAQATRIANLNLNVKLLNATVLEQGTTLTKAQASVKST